MFFLNKCGYKHVTKASYNYDMVKTTFIKAGYETGHEYCNEACYEGGYDHVINMS